LVSPANDVIPIAYKLGFEFTNNMTKYKALILGLKVASLLDIRELQIYGDSQLVINQVNDIYNIKYEKLCPYKLIVIYLLNEFDRYTIKNILIKNNRYADAMVSVASLAPIEIEDEEMIFKFKKLSTPSYVTKYSEIKIYYVTKAGTSPLWYANIYSYLKDQTIP